VRIIDHPISIRQSFWAPYKKLIRMIGEQMQKLAASKANSAEDKCLSSGGQQQACNWNARRAAQTAFRCGKFAGIFAAIGLASVPSAAFSLR